MSNYWNNVYKENKGYYTDQENPTRKAILDYINPADSIFDLGCGSGTLKELIPDPYFGMDYSEEAIRIATERFPTGKFMVGDIRKDAKLFKDNEYDVVVMRHFLENQEDWRETVRQAFRIANKKVIIVMRRPFINEPSKILENPNDTWVWDINFAEFNMLVRGLSVNVSYGKINEEEIVIIGKHLDEVVITLDDFHDTNHNLPLLLDLKKRFPKLKVTLFCIISKCSVEFLKNIKSRYGHWISLGLHGYYHDTEHGTARECDFWTYEETVKYLKDCEDWGVFDKVFRAPGWNMNITNYEALRDNNYIVADHLGHDRWEEVGGRRYTTGNLAEVHGHIQLVNMNGLEELASAKCNFGSNTEFYFIEEFINKKPHNYLPNRYQ